LDLIQTDLLLQFRLDQRSGGLHRSPYVYESLEVLPLVAPGRCAIVATSISTCPEVDFVASSSTFVRERNLHVRSMRVRHQSLANRYNILINRSSNIPKLNLFLKEIQILDNSIVLLMADIGRNVFIL
jgi:hypothetical protein